MIELVAIHNKIGRNCPTKAEVAFPSLKGGSRLVITAAVCETGAAWETRKNAEKAVIPILAGDIGFAIGAPVCKTGFAWKTLKTRNNAKIQ